MKTKITHVFNWITALLFLNAGLNKIFEYIPVPEDLPLPMKNDLAAIQEIEWLLPLLAVTEIAGGALLILNRTRSLGTLVLFPVAIGILLTHLIVEPQGLLISIFILVILIWNVWVNKEKFLPLIK